jgi:hypothetical protein
MLHHYLLKPLHRIGGGHVDAASRHIVTHRHAAQPQAPGPVDLSTGKDAQDLSPVIDYWKALKAVLLHLISGLVHCSIAGQRVHAVGHKLCHGHRRVDVLLEEAEKALPASR